MKSKMPAVFFLALLVTILVGISGIVGWIEHSDFLLSIFPGQVRIKMNVATSLLLSSIVLLLHHFPVRTRIRQPLSVLLSCYILIIGLLTMTEYIFGYNLGIDELFVKDDLRTTAEYFAGRMSPVLAANFVLIGIDLLLFNNERTAAFQFVSLATVAFVSVLMLIGLNFVTDIPIYIRVAIPSATGCIALATALYFAQPMLQRRIKFESIVLTGFAAIIILIALISTLSIYDNTKRITISRSIDRTNTTLAEAARVLSFTKDIVNGGGGYFLTGDLDYFKSFTLARHAIFIPLRNLRTFTADDPQQTSRIDSLVVFIEKRISYSLKCFQLKNEGRIDQARRLMATGQGKSYANKITALILELQQEKKAQLLIQQRDLDNSIISFNRALYMVIGSAFMLLLIIFAYTWSNISERKKS